MNFLIVFAHPQRSSLNGAFLDAAVAGLRLNNNAADIEILDLYRDSFKPVLYFDENRKRRELHKDPAYAKYRNQILKADAIVFIYPIWWGRPPAILEGYIDQVFSSGFAYRSVPGRLLPEGLLAGKKAVCISTMRGPALYPLLVLGNAHKRLMKTALLSFCGIKKVRFFQFGSMEKKDGKQGRRLRQIEKYFAGSDNMIRKTGRPIEISIN